MLAVAVANGTVIIYQWQDPTNLTSFNEFREINVMPNGECSCLSWSPAFDEPMTLVVGNLISSSYTDSNTGLNEAASIESNLLQLVTFNQETEKELDLLYPINESSPLQL